MAKNSKKLGSVSKLEKTDDRPLGDRIWDYKPHIIVAVIIILLFLVYFLVIKNLDRNPDAPGPAPSPTASSAADSGSVEITTQPPGAQVQLKSLFRRSPATFDNIPEGEHFVIINFPGYQITQKTVTVKKGEKTKYDFVLEK